MRNADLNDVADQNYKEAVEYERKELEQLLAKRGKMQSHMVDAFAYAMQSWPPKQINIFEDWYPWRIYRRWRRKRALEKMTNAFKPMFTSPKRKWFNVKK